MSRYWFARLMLGHSWKAAREWAQGKGEFEHYRMAMRTYRKRWYARLRAAGYSPYAASARISSSSYPSVAAKRRQAIQSADKIRARWGGDPSYVGSPAWLRRTVARELVATATHRAPITIYRYPDWAVTEAARRCP